MKKFLFLIILLLLQGFVIIPAWSRAAPQGIERAPSFLERIDHTWRKIRLKLKAMPTEAACPSRPYWSAKTPRLGFVDDMTLTTLLQQSNLVVEGTVKSLEACAPPRAGAAIVTYVSFIIDDILSGNYPENEAEAGVSPFDPSQITLPFLGGCAAGYCEDHSTDFRFARFDHMICFLRQARPFPVTGGTEGCFLITSEGTITNWESQPLIQCNAETGKLRFDGTVPTQPKAFDAPAYGGGTIVQGKQGDPRRCLDCDGWIDVPLPASGTPLTTEQFKTCIVQSLELHGTPTLETGIIKPASAPFRYGPHRAVPLPEGGS